jgi:hypothetical protein
MPSNARQLMKGIRNILVEPLHKVRTSANALIELPKIPNVVQKLQLLQTPYMQSGNGQVV